MHPETLMVKRKPLVNISGTLNMNENSQYNFCKRMTELLADNKIVFICHQQGNVLVQRPYRAWTDQKPNKRQWGHDVCLAKKTIVGNSVKVIDAINGDVKHINVSNIKWFQCHFRDDPENNLAHFNDWLESVKEALSTSESSGEHLTVEEREELLFSNTPQMFKTLCLFKFKINPTRIDSNKLTEEELKLARASWLDIIRDKREVALIELDELEEEVKSQSDSTEDDIKDIQTIKQMFRDIPQETDLEVHKTFRDLIHDWPALLLPYPEDLEILKEITALPEEQGEQPPAMDHNTALEQMVSKITNLSDLQKLYDEVVEMKNVPQSAKNILLGRIEELKV